MQKVGALAVYIAASISYVSQDKINVCTVPTPHIKSSACKHTKLAMVYKNVTEQAHVLLASPTFIILLGAVIILSASSSIYFTQVQLVAVSISLATVHKVQPVQVGYLHSL